MLPKSGQIVLFLEYLTQGRENAYQTGLVFWGEHLRVGSISEPPGPILWPGKDEESTHGTCREEQKRKKMFWILQGWAGSDSKSLPLYCRESCEPSPHSFFAEISLCWFLFVTKIVVTETSRLKVRKEPSYNCPLGHSGCTERPIFHCHERFLNLSCRLTYLCGYRVHLLVTHED